MTITISGSQQTLLGRSSLSPIFLVDITSSAGTLRFCTNRAVSYLGNLYQPYLSTVGTLRTAASFPENNTSSKELQLQFNNGQVEYDGTSYDHLSQTFYPVFPWELSDVQVRLLLTDGEAASFTEDVAMPWVTSGTAGAPTAIDRQKFLLPVYTRNFKLNDQIPLRPVTQEDFPEADRDSLTGKAYIPIVVGSGVRVQALATAAGATTTVTEEVSAGTVLKVSETTGFGGGDEIIINGFVNDPITIDSVDAANRQFTGLSPDLSTLGQTISLGTVVRENKTQYDYTVAGHECGAISEVRVTPRGEKDPVVISGTLYSKQTVDDANAIGGKRTDVRITQLVPFGSEASGGVTSQPEFSVDGGSHKHNVSVTQTSIATSFAGGTTPAGGSNANDGNTDTAFSLSTGGTTTLTYTSFSNVSGNHVSQTYYMVAAGPVVAGDVRIRRGVTAYLTLSSAFGKGEFRSAPDTGGSDTTTWNVIVQTSPTQCDLYEGWKEISSTPSVSEDTKDLSNTTRDTDVAVDVSGADIEIGDKVEVVIDGIPIPDDTGRFGPTTASGTAIQRPDGVARWFLEEVLGQTEDIIDLVTYSGSGANYDANGIRLSFALQSPTKLDTLFDQIANNSQSMHYWGRNGHALRYLEGTTTTGTFVDDQAGVISIDWKNAHTAADIRNSLTAFYGLDYTQTPNRDASYAGNVIANDTDSQALFGILGNEVTGADRSFFLDFTPTETQAQSILDSIMSDRANPQKEFTDMTDWTYINVEPGDIIEHNSPTLTSPVPARVIENTVDSRLFCRIIAKQMGGAFVSPAPEPEHDVSVKAGVIQNSSDNAFGISNEWTIMYKFKFLNAMTINAGLLSSQPLSPFSNNSKMLFTWKPPGFGDLFEVTLYDTNASDYKTWQWDSLFDGIENTWHSVFVAWDGTDIKLWSGPIGSISSSPITVDTKVNDDSITMGDPGRRLLTSAAFWHLYQVGMWNRELTQAEINFIDQNARHDLATDEGAYGASSNLKHYWKFFFGLEDLGKDYGNAALQIDINENGLADSDDLRDDAPT